MNFPSFDVLKDISDRLKNAKIPHALGGSGLLAYLGLVTEVRDWDITTDAPLEKVTPLFQDLQYELIQPNALFDSKYLCKIKSGETSIDLIGGFSVKTKDGAFNVPTLVSAEWEGVPVGSPGAWAKAYELMGRPEKAKLLLDYISRSI